MAGEVARVAWLFMDVILGIVLIFVGLVFWAEDSYVDTTLPDVPVNFNPVDLMSTANYYCYYENSNL